MAQHVVIVGAGLGGLRAAEGLRSRGYTDAITVIGDEPHHPYNRPPLSKAALADGPDPEALAFRRRGSLDDVTWILDRAVTSADLADRTVTLADGSALPFDGLVAATGVRPRRLPIPGPDLGRLTLRSIDDARTLRSELQPGRRVLILGAGFVGCEVAATARSLGCDVTVVAPEAAPMITVLGLALAEAMLDIHLRNGVHMHLGHTVQEFLGSDRVTGAVLDDGTRVEADVVLEAVGSVPNVEWLSGNGLDLGNGVLTDSGLRVAGTTAPVVAVGDIARVPLAGFGPDPRRIEHWNMPTETAKRAADTLAALLRGEEPSPEPFTAMPAFWSDQYDHTLQSFGLPSGAHRIDVVSADGGVPRLVEFHDDDGLVGVVALDATAEALPYRQLLAERSEIR